MCQFPKIVGLAKICPKMFLTCFLDFKTGYNLEVWGAKNLNSAFCGHFSSRTRLRNFPNKILLENDINHLLKKKKKKNQKGIIIASERIFQRVQVLLFLDWPRSSSLKVFNASSLKIFNAIFDNNLWHDIHVVSK